MNSDGSIYYLYLCIRVSHVRLFASPWTVAHQAPLSKEILQARILEWVAMLSSRGSSQPWDLTKVSCIAGKSFTTWVTREEFMCSNCGAGEDSWKSLDSKEIKPVNLKGSKPWIFTVHWKDWSWSWSSRILVIWCEWTTHWKRSWCWEGLRAKEEGVRGCWTASLMQWTWTWANSGRWEGTGRPGVLQSMGLQSQTQLGDWTTTIIYNSSYKYRLIYKSSWNCTLKMYFYACMLDFTW